MKEEGEERTLRENRVFFFLWKANRLSHPRSNSCDPLQTWLDKVMRGGFLKERLFLRKRIIFLGKGLKTTFLIRREKINKFFLFKCG